MGVNSAKQGRPSPEAIREAVWRAIEDAGEAGIGQSWLIGGQRGRGVGGITAAQRDRAIVELIAAGRVERFTDESPRHGGPRAVMYRPARTRRRAG